jgi:hypothetical protein
MFKISDKQRPIMKIFQSLSSSQIAIDSKVENTIHIIAKENEVTFIQENVDCRVYMQTTDIESDSEFTVNWQTEKLGRLMSNLNYVGELSEKGVKVPTGYFHINNIESHKNPEKFMAEIDVAPSQTIYIDDFDKLRIASYFTGDNQSFKYITLTKNHVQATDKTKVYRESILEGDPLRQELFIPPDIVRALQSFVKDEKILGLEICLYENKNFWSINIPEMNIKIFINHHTYVVPDMDKPSFVAQYTHDSHVIVDVKALQDKLKIMLIFAVDNPNNRLYIELKDKKMFIQSKDKTQCQEQLSCTYTSDLEGKSILVDASYFSFLLRNFEKQVMISFSMDKPAVRFQEDEDDERLILYSRLQELQTKK